MKKIILILGIVVVVVFVVGVFITQNNKIESKYTVSDDFQTVNIMIFDHAIYNGEYTIDTSGNVIEKKVGEKAEKLLNNARLVAFIYNKNDELIKILTDAKKVEKLRAKGYYIGPKTTIYSSEMLEKNIGFADIEANKKNGWYYGIPTTLYAEDGRELVTGENDVPIHLESGWSKEKFVTLYAPDGGSINIVESEVEDFKNVGWFETKEEAEAEKARQEKELAEQQAKEAEIKRTTICPVNGYSKIKKVNGNAQAEIYMCPAHGSHVYVFSLGCFLE